MPPGGCAFRQFADSADRIRHRLACLHDFSRPKATPAAPGPPWARPCFALRQCALGRYRRQRHGFCCSGPQLLGEVLFIGLIDAVGGRQPSVAGADELRLQVPELMSAELSDIRSPTGISTLCLPGDRPHRNNMLLRPLRDTRLQQEACSCPSREAVDQLLEAY